MNSEEHFLVIRLGKDGNLSDLDMVYVDVAGDGTIHIEETSGESPIVGLFPRSHGFDMEMLRQVFGAKAIQKRKAA